VLVELKRFPDARNAFARAVEADPAHAGAHYNLSFTLSNLGDFDGALRATKRALELDPYYVSQKFALTIDLQYEKATIGIAPEISADVTAGTIGEAFSFDQRLLDNIFQELEPPPAPEPAAGKAADDPLALARDYVSKGLMDVAAAEAVRAVQRGASRADAAVLLGDIFAKRGLHGEALERYREARALETDRVEARLGEVKALFALGGRRVEEARPLAEELLVLAPDHVDALVAVARGRAASGDAAGALTVLHQAQTRAPGRADLHKLQGDVATKVGDKQGALAAMLEQDPYDLPALLLLGRALLDDKRDAQALEAFRRALKFDPEQVEALFQLGIVLARLHRYGEAVEAWEKVTRLDPAGPFAQRARVHARTALDLRHIFDSDVA